MKENSFYIKNNKFRWGTPKFYIEFSNPQIQAFDDYGKLYNEEGILYYLYDVKIVSNKNKKHKVVCSTSTYDFPAITMLKYVLEKVIKVTEDSDGIGYLCSENKTCYSYFYNMSTASCFIEDFYELTKHIDKNFFEDGSLDSLNIYYDFSVFFNNSLNYSPNIKNAIVFSNLKESEIIQLYNCVCSFIEYSIEQKNKETEAYIETCKTKYFSKNHKLFKIDDNLDNRLENVFFIGDIVYSLYVLKTENDDYSSENYTNAVIKDIKESSLIINDNIEIPFTNILGIYREISSEQYYYGINDMVNEFFLRATTDEIEEFKTSSIDDLYNKYYYIFVNRNALYRNEHNFKIYKKNKDKNINLIVRKIITKIKNRANKEKKIS